MRRPISLAVLALAAAGCYRYVPAVQPLPSAGMDVRAHLAPGGTEALATTLGANVASIDARILADDGTSLRLSMQRSRTRTDRITSWTGEQVDVPRASISRMELRVIDRPRTIRVAAASVVGGVAIGLLFRSLAGSASGGGGRPPPPGG